MKTAPITYFADSRITLDASARHYTDALNDWFKRNGIEIELQHGYMQGRYEPNPQQAVPPQEWPSIIVNLTYAEQENDGSLSVDGQTGALVIDDFRIRSIAAPGTDRFHRHVRTIAHEFIHAYNPLEGYHLLKYDPLGQDWRTPGKEDTTGIFARNPGLRDDPWVDTQSTMERATIGEFNKLLIQQNIRNPWGWSKRGWFGEGGLVEVYLYADGDLTPCVAVLGFDRDSRWLERSGAAYDLHEFLHAALKTGAREIVVGAQKPEEKPVTTPESGGDIVDYLRQLDKTLLELKAFVNGRVADAEKRIEVLETESVELKRVRDRNLGRLNALESKLSKVREVYEQALNVL